MSHAVEDDGRARRVAHDADTPGFDAGPARQHVQRGLYVVVFLLAIGELAVALADAPEVEPERHEAFI